MAPHSVSPAAPAAAAAPRDRVVHVEDRPTDVLRGPWRPAPVVAALEQQTPQHRATLMAAAFAVVSAVWAPLGIALFLQRRFTVFLLLTLVAAVLLLAPRPRALGAPGALRTAATEARVAARPFLREVREAGALALRTVRERSGPTARTIGDRVARGSAAGRRAATVAWARAQERFEELGARARVRAAAWQDAGQRAGARGTGRDPQLSDPLSRWIGG